MGTSCMVFCSGSCSALCASSCGQTCRGGCASSCTGGCKNSCGNGCGDSCSRSCNNGCKGGCSGACKGGCKSSCTGGCSAQCGNTCGTSCGGNCMYGCFGGCQGDCGGNCAHSCGDGCIGKCTNGCSGTCENGCYSTCTGLCVNAASAAGPATGSGTSSQTQDNKQYYIKYSDIYEEYPHTSTSNAKQWKEDRDKGILYTRLDTLDELFAYYTDTLKPYYEDADNFKLTDDEKKSLKDKYGPDAEETPGYIAAKEEIIESKKDDWADKHHYKYYELLYNLCNEEENDDEQTKQKKAAAKELFNQRYNQFIKDYEAFIDTDEEDYDAETLVEYNKNGLLLLYPTMSEDIANEVQIRNTIYETYKKILEKKLKSYQKDLEALEKIENTLTKSTSQWADEIDTYDNESNLLEHVYSILRDVNVNRRYKDYGDSLLYDDNEINNLLKQIEEAGYDYISKLNEIDSFANLYISYYPDDSEQTAEKIVDILSDEYNRSELNKVKRLLDKYDNKEEDSFNIDEQIEKRDKLIAERDAKTAGYNAQLQKIQETIDNYIGYKNNIQAEIDLLQSEIDQYTAEIANAKNKIGAADAELNKYTDDEIESDNLIDYFAQNPDIQKNVNILKTYLNWLNEIEQNIKKDIAASIGEAADSIDNYLEVLKELITKYMHEAFYFFHHYDSLEEDIDEIIENSLEDKNLTLNSFKNILYLGDNLLNENVDENSENYPTLCKEALEKQLIFLSNEPEAHTYNFGIYKYENNFYLMGLNKNDSDMYYPIPQWIGAEEAESFVEEEILQYAESRGIEGEQNIQSSISIVEPATNGSWVKDPTSSPVYRILPENTLYNEEKEYYNVDQTVYQYIDEDTWISDVENKRVMWKTGFKVKTFEIFDYTMLYDYLVFNPKLEGRVDTAIENSIIFLPLDPSYPIHPHEMATYYQEIIGNAVYEYGEENLIGSLSRLTILENLYRTSFINYIYAFISQQNFEINDDNYKGYLDLKDKWTENKNELLKWQSQLASLQQVYESGWSENTKEADQGKKQQLEDLIYLTNQQISYYEQQVRIYERQLNNTYQAQFNTDNLVTEAITATKREYDINKTTLENEYNTYIGKVNHYLNLLFNDKPQGIPINSSIAHSITDTEYNLGINSAINSYNKYSAQKEEGGQNIDFSALIARINAFSDNYQKHYNLYELVKSGEEYDDLVYKYYYKVNDSYKPYGDYNTIQWNIDISNEKVYKVNQYLDEFNNIIYTLVPINASYSNEVIYCIKNEKENDYDVIEKESNETQAEYEERWESYKNNNNLYTLTIGENGGILQFLNNLLANSEYVQNIIKIYNDSLALYDSLVQQQLGDNSSYQELIEAKNRYEQQLRDLQEITQYKDAADIDHAQAYLDIMAALAKYLQVLTITYIEAVEKRYSVS